eukprot:1308564-Ditylum_brightwellii.AAC.2
MDTMWLFCLNGALPNNNAEPCYDRMIPEVTTMHLCKHRVRCLGTRLGKQSVRDKVRPPGLAHDSVQSTDRIWSSQRLEAGSNCWTQHVGMYGHKKLAWLAQLQGNSGAAGATAGNN